MAFTIRAGTPSELETVVAIDDDASRLYFEAGLDVEFAPGHPFVVNERTRWRRSLEQGHTLIAVDDAGTPVGIAVLELLDGAPYLEQLSVRRSAMRRGLGRMLLGQAVSWARAHGDCLWLTTYGHLPWNRPFYEKEGFVVVPRAQWGADVAARNAEERAALPAPEQRVVMRRALSPDADRA
jgi:GNAT superfamily N-acetyltransferase